MAEGTNKNPLAQFEDTLDEYFGKKAPALPQNIREFIVKIAPYSAIIFLIFTLFGFIGYYVLGQSLGGFTTIGNFHMLLLVPVVILEAMAVPGLFSRKAMAWRYMFWALIISSASNLVQLNIVGGIISTLISALIGFYILFQIKSFYK
ncbi:MAG: hypothetical protein AAB531_04235 [Patescibacteria group bacterium]